MRISQFLVFIIGLVLSLTASASVTEEQIRQHLPGKWQLSYSLEGGSFKATTIYETNGQFISHGTIKIGDVVIPFRVKGNWTVSNDKVTGVFTESNVPEIIPVGGIEIDTVLVMDKTTYTYLNERGTQTTETRVPTS